MVKFPPPADVLLAAVTVSDQQLLTPYNTKHMNYLYFQKNMYIFR